MWTAYSRGTDDVRLKSRVGKLNDSKSDNLSCSDSWNVKGVRYRNFKKNDQDNL